MLIQDKKVTECLLNFQKFLQVSWHALPSWIHKDQSEPINDWLQANWEVLVEYPLSSIKETKVDDKETLRETGFDTITVSEMTYKPLRFYGDGADGFYGRASSRMLYPELAPEWEVMVGNDLVFISFGTLNEDYFWQGHPFDMVKAERKDDREEIILLIEECRFRLQKVTDKIFF